MAHIALAVSDWAEHMIKRQHVTQAQNNYTRERPRLRFPGLRGLQELVLSGSS
jgi:hypothetical protein